MAMNETLPVPNILIAVMGATGTGKSTLIHTLTGDENIHIGHGQESQTDQVQLSTYFDFSNNCNVTLVDTPGFDDSRDGVTDTDILRKIIDFLQYSGGQRLNGLIYMHRISDPKMGKISKRNLKMFKQLCGDGTLKNVCIATTNWDRVTKEEGNRRERELRESSNLFQPLINEGAQLVRHDKGITSAHPIINYLIYKDPTKLQIQVELDEGKTLEETKAGSVLKEEIKAVMEKLEAELLALKEEMEDAARERHAELLEELEEEHQKGEAQREKMEEDLQNLKMQAQCDEVKHEVKVCSLEDNVKKREAELLAELERNNRENLELSKQAQRDKEEYEAKMRSLENKMALDMKKDREAREDMERNNRECFELLKQQVQRGNDEHEAKMSGLDDRIAAVVKEREAELLAERKAREELERNNRERLELLKQQAQCDKDEYEAKMHSLEDKVALDMRKWEAELLAERNARAELERNNYECLELLKHGYEAKMRSLEDKMEADAKTREAELQAEREAREELERNNHERLKMLKQQAQSDKLKQEEKLRSLETKMTDAREKLERSNFERLELLKHEHEAKIRSLEDRIAADVEKRERELLVEREAREEIERNNCERLELLKQQAQRDKIEHEAKIYNLEDKIAVDMKKREEELLVERETREDMERNNRERLALLKHEYEAKMHSLEDKIAVDLKKWEAELLAERDARAELERNNRERLGLLKHECEAKMHSLEDKIASDMKKWEAELLAERNACVELEQSLVMLKQQAQSARDEHEAKMRSLEDKIAADVKKRKAELQAERKAREELGRNNCERLEMLKQQAQYDKDLHEANMLALSKRLEAEARAREAENKARAEQERKNQVGWGNTITSTFWGILYYTLTFLK